MAQKNVEMSTYSGQSTIRATNSVVLKPGFIVPAGSTLTVKIVSGNDCPTPGTVLSAADNYILVRSVKIPGITTTSQFSGLTTCDANETVQYFDGLGRPLQTVTVKGASTTKDLVQPMAYDVFGREAIKYMPYAAESSDNPGSYRANALTGTGGYTGGKQYDFYQQIGLGYVNTTAPFSITRFEESPIGRQLEQGAAGTVWQPSGTRTDLAGRTVVTEYKHNTSTGDHMVRRWYAESVTTTGHEYERTLAGGSSVYAAGELIVTITKDENWVSGNAGTSAEYKDKDGRVVAKRNWKDDTNALTTYYVYDDLGNLSFVLPPGASPDNSTISTDNFNYFCYQYRYDARRRLIQKKIPGKDSWDDQLFNLSDQLVYTQDPVQRNANERRFTKYDALGRVIMTGMVTSQTNTRQDAQDALDNPSLAMYETRDAGQSFGYTWNSLPSNQSITEVHTVSFYDNYDIPGLPSYADASKFSKHTQGLITATMTRVLGTSSFLWTVYYYNDRGQAVATYKQHYKGGTQATGNYDLLITSYDEFTAVVLSSELKHFVSGTTTPVLNSETSFDFDHLGRPVNTRQRTADNTGGRE